MASAAELALKISAQDLTGGALDKVAKQAQGLGGAVGGAMDMLGKVGLAGLGIKALAEGVGGLASSMVSGNAEFERYQTQFGVLLGGADAAKERLKDLADFGARTPFELPEVVRADKILQSFGFHTEEAAKKFGMSGVDIRTIVGDVAAGTGAGFEAMAGYIGRFASGSTGEAIMRFQELGVTTKEELGKMGMEFSKSGELLSPLPEATEILLKVMKQKYGGMMDAQSSTFEGMMSNLQDWIGQTKNAIMQPLFEVLKDKLQGLLTFLSSDEVKGAITAFAQAIGTGISVAIDIIGKLSNIIGPLVGLISNNLVGAFQALLPVMQAVASAAKLLFTGDFEGGIFGLEEDDPIITTLLDINDAAQSLIGVFTGAEGAGLDFHNMLESLVGLDVANWIINIVQKFQALVDEIGKAMNEILPLVEPAFENVKKVVMAVMAAVLGTIIDHWDQIKQYIDGVLQIIQGIITITFGLIRGIIKMVLALIGGDFDAFGAAFEETWRTLWEGIKNILSGALDIIQSVLSLAWDAIQAVAKIAWDAFKALIQAVWDALLAYVTSQIEKLKADLSSAWETIKSVAETAWNLVRTTVENVWKALQKAIDEFLETIQTNIEKVWKAIQTKTAEVWQAMRNKIDEMIKSILGIFEGYIKAINGVIGAVGGLLDWISKIPSFVKMPDILPGKVVAPPGAPPGSEPGAPPEEVMEGVARALGIGAMSLRAFGAVVDSFKTKLKELIEGIAALAGEMNNNPMIIISAKAFSEGVLPIVDFVSKATSALIELRKVRALTIETFDALREGIKGVITALASLAGGWEGVSPDAILGAKAFAQAVGPAFEAISKAIDVLGKLKDYSQIGKAHVTGFINNIVEMIEQLVEISGAWDDGILEMVKVFTGVVGPAIADIGKGFELLEKLKDYSQIGKEHARGFINNLVEIVDHLAEIAGAWSVELQDSMALISETIGKVVSGIAPGIELLAKLKDYAQIGQVHIQGFINNLVEIVDLMAGIAGVWERELQEKIQLISDTIDKIASGLEGSLDMFEKLKDYSQIAKEHGQGLVNNLVELMDLFAGIANVWPEDLQEKIKKLLTTMDEIVDTLIKASGLKDLTPMTEQVLAFRDAIVALLQEVGAGFTEMVNEVRLNLVALADAFSESVSSAWAWSGELVKAIDDVVVALAKLPVGALVPSTATPLIGTPGGGYTSNSVNNSSVVNVGTVNMSNNNNIQEAILMMNLLAVPRR